MTRSAKSFDSGRFYRATALLIFCAVPACRNSVYKEHEVGDQTEILNTKNQHAGIGPDVVFYEVFNDKIYGVKRLGDKKSTTNGYWAECKIFRGDSNRIQFYEPEEIPEIQHDNGYKRSINLAMEKCRNFSE